MRRLKDDIIKHLSLFGNCFIRKRYNYRSILKYEVLDTRYVYIITDYDLNVLRYQYQPPIIKGKVETFERDEIYHVRETTDIDNPTYGVSILETLVNDVMGDEEASQSNYYYFGNDSIPSALFVLKDGLTKDQQNDQLKLIQETLQGGHNKHKNITSNAIVDIKPIQSMHTDASFVNQRNLARDKICAAFGVSKSVLGYVDDVNRANGQTQYEKFIENTIRPWEKLLEEIFTHLLKDYGKNLVFRIADEHIDDMKERSTVAITNVQNGIWTRNEARQYLGYDILPNEFADELTVLNTQQLLDNLANANPPPDPDRENIPDEI